MKSINVDETGTEVFVWSDESNEDYTHKFVINEHDFKEEY